MTLFFLLLLQLSHYVLYTHLCLLNCINDAIQVTNGRKYSPPGPHAGQPCFRWQRFQFSCPSPPRSATETPTSFCWSPFADVIQAVTLRDVRDLARHDSDPTRISGNNFTTQPRISAQVTLKYFAHESTNLRPSCPQRLTITRFPTVHPTFKSPLPDNQQALPVYHQDPKTLFHVIRRDAILSQLLLYFFTV